jgi:hypothetical protein
MPKISQMRRPTKRKRIPSERGSSSSEDRRSQSKRRMLTNKRIMSSGIGRTNESDRMTERLLAEIKPCSE